MLKINVTNDRTYWLWRVEIKNDGDILFSRTAHSLEELAQILADASKIVAHQATVETE